MFYISILENLSNERVLTEKEIENVKKLYKINLDKNIIQKQITY